MTSAIFQTSSDHVFFNKLSESVRRIFSTQKQDWSCEQILRFLALIKVESKLETIFYEFKITGELLFDAKYLWSQMNSYLENKTYFPIMKLMYVILKLNFMENKEISQVKFVRTCNPSVQAKSKTKIVQKQDLSKQSSPQHKSAKLTPKNCKTQSSQTLKIEKNIDGEIPDLQEPEEELFEEKTNYISADGEILQSLEKEFKKLGESLIADLSCIQLARIFRSTQNERAIELSEIIKKYSIDGYCIVCLLTNRDELLEEIRSFFSVEQIANFEEILNLILPFYYKQIFETEERETNKSTLPELNGFNLDFLAQTTGTHLSQDPTSNSNLKQSFGTSEMGTSQMGTSEMGTSQIYGQSQTGEGQGSVEYGTSEYDTGETYDRKQSMGKSEYGRSEYGNSVYGKSELGNSEYAASQYAASERGSIHESMGESVIGESVVFQENKQKRKDVRISSVEDTGIIQRLKEVALQLPFNLFKMDPLQNIKVVSLSYPFTINFQKPKCHQEFVKNVKFSVQKMKQCGLNTGGICERDFNITGVKFGRSQENDYRYPDELSISAKHAQIGFWNNKYQLVDLQSKTGTFLYIPLTRPLILKDQHIIQLSNQIQIIVHILKKQATEGTIKLEFTKPENQPFYKATLKQNQTLKIGRSQKSHIKLTQQSISSKHTEIKYENKEFKIYDCLSPTGTWLRLSKKGAKSDMFPLEEGDIIRISSKKTYLIQKMTNSLQEDDQEEDYEDMQAFLQNPNFKVLRQNSEDNFKQIIENAMKRKTPYEKKRQVHFEDPFQQFNS